MAKDFANGIDKPADPNWLENHRRVKKPVRDSFTVSVDLSVDAESSGSFGIEASHTWVWVNCCKYTNRPFYWCNAALQNNRC